MEIKLTNDQILKAIEFKKDHETYVFKMTKNITYGYPPSKEDINHPELWKASHWKWFEDI